MDIIGILVMAGQLILALSILVALHELGHLLTAKWFKMRVDQYSIGFPPKIWGFKKGETEYMIGAIPLGGYVKIAGMVDESLDTATLNEPPKPWEFRSKPAWQRLIVMLGGIFVNVLTGITIFILLTYIYGKIIEPASKIDGIVAHKYAEDIGLKTGDRLIKINGKEINNFNEEIKDALLGSNSVFTIERDGKQQNINIPNNLIEKLSDKKSAGQFIEPFYVFSVGEIEAGSPAEKAGLKEKDKIIQVDETPIKYFHQMTQALALRKGKETKITVIREGQQKILDAKVDSAGHLGFHAFLENKEHVTYSFGESVKIGTVDAFKIVFDQIKGFGKMFKGEINPLKSLSGPIGIAKMFGRVWDWLRFWQLTGFLSMVLAFMNLLPIPALDGGHVIFLVYEIVSGRKPSDKFLEIAQKVGMIFLLALMVFVIFSDIIKSFIK